MTEVVAALIFRNGKFLICKRPENKARAGMWEFVGGKVEKGETKERALIRECKEELDVEVSPSDLFSCVTHVYPDITVKLYVYLADIVFGEPKAIEHSEIKWISVSETDGYSFCPADINIIEKIKKVFR